MSLLCFSFLCLVSCAFGQDALKAMPLGRVQPVQTLVARPQGLSSGPHAGLLNDSHLAPGKLTDQNAGPVKDDGKRGHSLFPVADIDHASSTEPAGDEFGLYVPYDERSGTTLVRPGLTKRATFRGTMMMNCKRSLEACQNACWYQNCIKGARGDPAKAPYTFMYSSNNDVNRVEAGTMVRKPCRVEISRSDSLLVVSGHALPELAIRSKDVGLVSYSRYTDVLVLSVLHQISLGSKGHLTKGPESTPD